MEIIDAHQRVGGMAGVDVPIADLEDEVRGQLAPALSERIMESSLPEHDKALIVGGNIRRALARYL